MVKYGSYIRVTAKDRDENEVYSDLLEDALKLLHNLETDGDQNGDRPERVTGARFHKKPAPGGYTLGYTIDVEA